MEDKPDTSSLNICLAVERGGGGQSNASLPPPTSVDILFKDDVTVILLLGVTIMQKSINPTGLVEKATTFLFQMVFVVVDKTINAL